MSDRPDAPNASTTTLSRVFVGDPYPECSSANPFPASSWVTPRWQGHLVGWRVLANETISDSDKVGGDRDRGGTAKRGVYQRSSRPESDDAEYHPAMTPGLHARAS